MAGTPRARKRRREKRGMWGEEEGGRIAGSERKSGCKEVKRETLLKGEHKVTERSTRHSGFDIPSASD